MIRETAADELPSIDEEELQLDYEDKCNEVVELQHELRIARLEAQQLRLRLQAAAKKNGSNQAQMAAMPAVGPSAGESAEEQRSNELHTFLRWLAEHADLSRVEVFDVGYDVDVAGRFVQMQRIAQFPLTNATGGQLRMSIPIEHQESITGLLAATKACGGVDAESLRRFCAVWDLVPGELMTAARRSAEPAVLLALRGAPQGILVASWPTPQALEAFRAVSATVGETPLPGDRVEVEYEGAWYNGILHSVDAAGKASVRCDVDAPGVLTIAPLFRVRRMVAMPPVAHQETHAAVEVPPTPHCADASRSAELDGRLRWCNAVSERRAFANHRRTRSAM